MGFKPDLDDQLVSFSALTLLVWYTTAITTCITKSASMADSKCDGMF